MENRFKISTFVKLLEAPGELRIISKESFIDGIKEGVKDGKPICEQIKEAPYINLSEGEIIIKPELCIKEKEEVEENRL